MVERGDVGEHGGDVGAVLSSVSPSSAAKTTMAVALAASGKFSSSRSMARALWLPGAEKSSVKVPPAAPARKNMAPMTRTQEAMVRQGCLALVMAMLRVNLSMVVPFEVWVDVAGGPRARRMTETRGSPMSRTFCSSPCSADWSTTWPRMTVVPSLSW